MGVWMGINDIGNSYYLANYNTLVNQILGRYFDQVQILYNAGVRKFLFLSVPPINKTPVQLMQSSSSQQQEAAAITTYNNLIVSKAKAFKSANPGVRTYYLDTSTPFNTAIANPTAYGAPDATCFDASGTKCLWWNNVCSNWVFILFLANSDCSTIQDKPSRSSWHRPWRNCWALGDLGWSNGIELSIHILDSINARVISAITIGT